MKTPRQRLAAVIGKCFETQHGNSRDELRHYVYSQIVGREIKSSDDLADSEVQDLLSRFEHHLYPFNPSDAARAKINTLARQYQEAHGQMALM